MSTLATVSVVCAIMFASWALYVSLVEHPARMASGAGPGRAQFRPSYRRAAPWQASFALVGCLGAVPFTFVAIMPTNRRLLDGGPLGDDEVRRLLQRWGRLHALRTALGAVAVGAFLLAWGGA